ncbi:DNA polymerase epsilon catalytic subunit A [Babesia sp. Xinjiang]|uniref:DNA polymerase epsilon catalytic subunit A n=1 Tax=Babesia sp. Xinjiang TaxID=462227 RepID=UPI000A220EAD|nr:DNA polymerase epsilon catalytic subunit A [Babesia sp. Xinjiang]ORM39971.1 DNA polymerase epsilon catalytic subunit A [Babesia sp. Xinjiang]
MQRAYRSPRWSHNGHRSGFLYNVVPTTVSDGICVTQSGQRADLELSLSRSTSGTAKVGNDNAGNVSRTALALYFVSEDGSEWHTTVVHAPYFYVSVTSAMHLHMVRDYLDTKFASKSIGPVVLEPCVKVDLSLPNHIERFDPVTGRAMHGTRHLIKISFNTIDQLERARILLQSLKQKFVKKEDGSSEHNTGLASLTTQYVHDEYFSHQYGSSQLENLHFLSNRTHQIHEDTEMEKGADCLLHLGDIYEHDVRYVNRVCIDLSIRCGTWYDVDRVQGVVSLSALNKATLPPLNVFAWDIECYKAPLKFPDVENDEIILISAMFNGQGYLIVNRSVVARDISEFAYHPSDEMAGAGSFKVFNEQGELKLLQRFFTLITSLAPHIIVTYNGDSFDFPYVQRRAQINGLSMESMLGLYRTSSDVYTGNAIINMDCYKWVERDSYLPFGSRTLKQVCKIKLKYNPTELDPEEMVPCARNDPQTLAVYSVSDAVATYYLYMKYIHSFTFALCYIVPLPPNDVLRQGSGTLCENLLMAEAYANGVLFPNKHQQAGIRYFRDPATSKHHFIYENSYIGARVETLRCGLFRDDLEERFELNSSKYQELLDDLDMTLKSWADANLTKDDSTDAADDSGTAPDSMDVDGNELNPPTWLITRFARFSNFQEVYRNMRQRLIRLRDEPVLHTFPRIYHLDVGAMYPNIILSQRLQPTAIVTEQTCKQCSYYNESDVCQKRMQWKQKLEISPVDRNHILPLLKDLESRTFKSTAVQYDRDDANAGATSDGSSNESDSPDSPVDRVTIKTWHQLNERKKAAELQKVIKAYSQRVFHKMKINKEVDVESIVCQRENPFYVRTVQKFRDKRYVYKKLKKDAETALKELLRQPKGNAMRIKEMRDSILLNDSLQLAHKCILNSFYGYVKRGGSRWYSMEMGAIVTYAGAEIIDSAHRLMKDIGIPIELDTDGIWCMLPDVFPAVVDLEAKDGTSGSQGPKTVELEYMTTVLNRLIERQWTNDQYLEMEDVGRYRRVSRNEILFELDGPWHAMFLPASEKSEELLKKRYVVFNHQKQIVELKGFEIKRRGEMRMIQLLQEEVFPRYLLGSTKEEAYQNAASIGLSYRRSLDSRAANLEDDDMFDLLVARKTVKRPVAKQSNMKCFGITTARRLAELFKDDSYINDGNLCMSFLLASHPADAPRTARAIPIQTFKVDVSLRSQCLARWLKLQLSTAVNSGVRDILDWDYYREKLDTQMLKLVCIPAVLQGLENPVPMIQLPAWLKKREMTDSRQRNITSFFAVNVNGVASSKVSSKRNAAGGSDPDDSSNLPITATSNVKQQPVKLLNVKAADISPRSITWIKGLKVKWLSLVKDFQRHRRRLQHDINRSVYVDLKRGMLEAAISHGDTQPSGDRSKLDFSVIYMLMTERWHVYSCTLDPENPTVMKCIVSVHNKPIFVTVHVELWRKLYVNCLKYWEAQSNENISVRAINERYILPRGSVQKNLFELEMRESYFLKHIRNSLSSIFHKTLLGVYEAQVPISFDFAVKLGNVVQVHDFDASAAVTPASEFRSKALQGITTMQVSDVHYLEDVEIIFVHVFHGLNPDTNRRNRVFAAVYRKGQDSVNHVFVGGASSNFPRAESEFPNALSLALDKQRVRYEHHESIRHESYKNPERFPDCFGEMYEPHYDLSATAAAGCRTALRNLDTYLQSLQPQVSQRKCIVYAYSTVELSDLGEWSAGDSWPVHWDRNVSSDHHHLPSNGFISKALGASLALLYKHRTEVELKLSMSRVASLPLGNLLNMSTVDANKHLLDVMYARSLRSSSALLWGTGEAGCDLGVRHSVHMQASDYDITCHEGNFCMSSAGVYRGYGAKIAFNQSLMYNAIMLESRLATGSQLAGCDLKRSAPDGTPEELQHEVRMAHMAEFHPLSFRILGSMFDNLIKLTNTLFEKVEYGTFQQLINICAFIKPWLSDPISIMYDPGLYSRALLCTQQYLSSLLQQVESSYQLRTVYVTQTYVVVDTNTLSVTKGRHRVHEAFDNLGSNDPRFRNIPFYVEEEYVAQIQLAADCYIRYKNYVDATHENCTESLKPLEYLPGAVEMFVRYFLKTVALDPLWKTLGEYYDYEIEEDGLSGGSVEPKELLGRDNNELRKALEEHVVHDWLQPGVFFSRMCELLEDADAFLSTFDSQGTFGRLEFPNMPGSFVFDGGNWRMEAVKLVAHVLRIDSAVDWNDLSKITAYEEKRHQLFTLAGESEYAAGDWQPPMQRLDLPSVCCNDCFMVFNLDVISSFTTEETDSGITLYYWRCELCGARLRNRDIELRMIKFLEQLFCAYQAQDMLCPECRIVKQLPLARVCQCGGAFIPRLVAQRWEDSCAVMSQLADIVDMKSLREVLSAYGDMW